MFKRNLIVVWVGIVVLSGMFLMGQESWSPPPCTDLDGDGYGIPASSLCTYPGLDCDDSDGDVNPAGEEICGNAIDDDCDGKTDEVCRVTAVKAYEISDPTITGDCDGLYYLLSCSDAASCMTAIGLQLSGNMDIEYNENSVLIQLPPVQSGTYTIDPTYFGSRSGDTFSANTSYAQATCIAGFNIGTATLYSTMTGGEISADSFSGTLDAQVTITGCGTANDGTCVIDSDYLAQPVP